MYTQSQKLLDLLSNHKLTFYIPPYQRKYEWEKEQCRIFLSDVRATAKSNLSGRRAEHFFGSITYFQTPGAFGRPARLVLIDGQQRITTTMLFLCALRDVIEDAEMKDFIDGDYLMNGSVPDGSDLRIKLRQVEADWQVYRKIVLGQELDARDRQSPVYVNYLFFRKEAESLRRGDDRALVSELIDGGLSKFNVITVELQPDANPWENPQEIFESMNSLGKPLSLADLVRNYLLLGLRPEEQARLYSEHWMVIERALPGQISAFIRDYMQCVDTVSYPQATDTNHKKLYGIFKETFAGRDAEELLKSLAACSEAYAWIVSGTGLPEGKIKTYLSDIREIGATTANSFLLALLREWQTGRLSDTDTEKLLRVLRTYLLRRRIIGETAPENKLFPAMTAKIPAIVGSADRERRLFELLADQEYNGRLPNDTEIERHAETMNFYSFRLNKFVLRLIEEDITKSRPRDDKKLQLEHIMPQKLSDGWREEIGQGYERVHQVLLHNIGNITLIRFNQELSNRSFGEKKAVYDGREGLQVSRKWITDRERWDESAILRRQRETVRYLLENVLPVPDGMRAAGNYAAAKRTSGAPFSFRAVGLIGKSVVFIKNPEYTAKVVGDREVEFEGRRTKLSPLTRELFERMGRANSSGAYQGAQYWSYGGVKLARLMEQANGDAGTDGEEET